MTYPVVMTIAGSDSGGGAGVQADLRTFGALGCHGTTVVTALTAQNLEGVQAVHGLPPELVEAQARSVLDGFEVCGAKTGMLWSAEIISRVARLQEEARLPLVVDPVMVATSGDMLLEPDAVRVYREQLLPRCLLTTPNLDEAAVLLERGPISRNEMPAAAEQLARRLGCAVLLKGGHLAGDPLDLLWHEGQLHSWQRARVGNVNTHGTGCTLSAALAALLAHGRALPDACDQALAFVNHALRHPHHLGHGVALAGIEEGGLS